MEILAQVGLKLIALRCAGYNNLDLTTAKDLNLRGTRVPAYSPHAVTEHAIGLWLSLNRKIFRAYNRVRDLGGLLLKSSTDLMRKSLSSIQSKI